jgi:hypothetical protein
MAAGHRPQVEVTDQFIEWWEDLSLEQQVALAGRVELLAEQGPSLGRPAVERIHTSRHHNMKELRASEGGAPRVSFMFDPRRQVILLLGGDKRGKWNDWYEWAVPAADDLYDEYLDELRREGLI